MSRVVPWDARRLVGSAIDLRAVPWVIPWHGKRPKYGAMGASIGLYTSRAQCHELCDRRMGRATGSAWVVSCQATLIKDSSMGCAVYFYTVHGLYHWRFHGLCERLMGIAMGVAKGFFCSPWAMEWAGA